MNCRELTDFIMRYLDGELPRNEHDPFEQHVSRCPPCGRYLEQYKITIRAGKVACAESDSSVPADVPEELIRAILESRKA